MPLTPIKLPPGVYRNGTALQAMGRWRDASRVRWHEGVMRPIGGWVARVASTLTKPRAAHAWQDLTSNRRLAMGSASKLVSILSSGAVTDITPAGLTAGLPDATQNFGYGGGSYSAGLYGTPRLDPGVYSEATTWSLDNFGQLLVACSVADGRLWSWDLNPANDAVVISGAPTGNLGLVVTEERFLFALGAGGNPRKVQWADQETLTTWTPASTNQAGDLELQSNGQIMCAVRVRGQTLILTDVDAHVATYLGPPFVYGFEKVAGNCSTISRRAAVAYAGSAIWMGLGSFFMFNGGSAEELACDVDDYVFSDMNKSQQSKVWACTNADFGEVWWFYPSGSSNEIDRYVSYNVQEKHWATGELVRTAGVDRGVFRNPLFADLNGQVYNHETGSTFDGIFPHAETGPMYLGNGDNVMMARSMVPDEATQGDVQVRFKTKFYPNGPEREYGPFAMATPTNLRFTGKQIAMRIEGVRPVDWRVGPPRLDLVPGGER